MRFLIVSLFVGLALGSPIGQVEVEVTTSLPQDLLRSDLELDATTVVVEILSDDATISSVTERARQAPAGGEDESAEDNEEDEPTTSSPGGSLGSSSTGARTRPQPAIPQPLANSSDFLAEYQFSSQFNLGPKDEAAPLALAPGQVAPAVVQEPQIGQAQPPVPQVAESAVPNLPPAVPASPVVGGEAPVPAPAVAAAPLSAGAPAPAAPVTPVIIAGEDEDDAESDEDTPTEAPSARLQQQQQQQIDAQRVEESDSDNEITSDDVTTVKSFISEYEYTVQQLGGGGEKRVPSRVKV